LTERLNTPGWATYLRVSDEDKQSPERSFAMQRSRIKEQLLGASEFPFNHEYRDMLTGTNPNWADYQKLLADAQAGKFSHLGLYRADHFGRNAVEGLQAATSLISLGIKIRVANMPTLTPEEPDGFFMFLIQMGLAQRELDVLAQRTADGMEAKLRAGGWPQKAPDGYVNKERQEKVLRIELSIAEFEHEKMIRIDDLDAALVLMTRLGVLFERLGDKERSKLLQILVKRFIVDPQGKIIDFQLNTPFAYLQDLVKELSTFDSRPGCSTQVSVGAQVLKNRSTSSVERFLSSIRFENRERLAELGLDL